MSPVLSVNITICVFVRTFDRLGRTLSLFLRGVPSNVSISRVGRRVDRVRNILSIRRVRV